MENHINSKDHMSEWSKGDTSQELGARARWPACVSGCLVCL